MAKSRFLGGAGSGVGGGIALALGKAGASIGMMGRTRETLEQTKAKLDAVSSFQASAATPPLPLIVSAARMPDQTQSPSDRPLT